jgi:ferredoxin-NADP reductase/ferredoxin
VYATWRTQPFFAVDTTSFVFTADRLMPDGAHENKLPRTVFAFFVWQADLMREITAAEAEAFFQFLDGGKPNTSHGPLKSELTERYPKFWREYLKQGPPPPLELSLLTHKMDENLRAMIVQMLSALHRASPGRKRRQIAGLSQALMRLLQQDDSALNELQRYFQKSRFYEIARPAGIAPSAEATEITPPPTIPQPLAPEQQGEQKIPSLAGREGISEKTFDGPSNIISVLKLVSWSEHDAVNPERLQFWTKGSRIMRCIGIIDRSPDFKSFQFMAEEPMLFFYKPGQFVTLELMIEGKRALRSYTISSSPSRPHLIEISVKRLKNGLVSNYLHDRLNIGDTIMMKPPAGKFHCFDTMSDKYLFLAAGSGITPMLSMARWWHDTGAHPDVIFFHSVREPEDAVFAEDMITFTSANRNFRYVTSFTSPTIPENWPGMKGRFNEEKLFQIAPDFSDRMVFTCGPDSFMKNVKLVLEKNQFVIQDRFRQESFGSGALKNDAVSAVATTPGSVAAPAPEVLLRPVKTFSDKERNPVVHFSLSALELFGGDMDIPILELAEEVGIEIPSSCRAGTCGTCRAMKIKGDVECEDTPGLTDVDREAGYILTCVSRAKNYVEIEV